jgi:hypothetical protein
MPTRIPTHRSMLLFAACLLAGFSPLSARGSETAGSDDSSVVAPAAFPSETQRREQTGRGGFSPGEALGIGLLATAGPTLIALGTTNTPEQRYSSRPMTVFLATTAGIVVGPSIGLASGGRGDLAGRGIALRAVGLGVFTLSMVGAATSAWSASSNEGNVAGLLALGAVSGALTVVSALHDLVITPSAVARGRGPRASLGVRPDGMVAVSVRF